MTTNFSRSPYYDDFDDAENYYKILFQPSRPVQTRELNQLQSILQKQIAKNGDFMFKNGAMIVPGQIFFDNTVTYLTVNPVNDQGVSADVQLNYTVGTTLSNGTTVTAIVIYAEASTATDPTTLFIRYTGGNGTFAIGDTITATDNSVSFVVSSGTSAIPYTGTGSIVTINDGVYYVNGTFVNVVKQTISLDKYSNIPNYTVGLNVVESIVTAADDPSLYDNALGYPNYGAPGADRYKITLTLGKQDYSITQTTGANLSFIDLLQVNKGVITFEVDDTAFASFERLMATRTYDEAGDFLVNPFTFSVTDYRSNNRGNWTANTAYLVGDIVLTAEGTYWQATSSGISSTATPFTNVNSQWEFTDGSVTWVYVNAPVFNNGINTESNTVSLDTMIANDQQLVYRVSPGSGYIKGVRVVKQGPSFDATKKAVDFDYQPSEIVNITAGSNLSVTNVTGIPNIDTYETVNIYYTQQNETWSALKRPAVGICNIVGGAVDVTSIQLSDYGFGYDPTNPPTITLTSGSGTGATFKANISITGQIQSIVAVTAGAGYTNGTGVSLTISAPAGAAPIIGTCRVRSMEFLQGTLGTTSCVYELQVFDVKLNQGYNFQQHAFSLQNASGSFKCDINRVYTALPGAVSTTSGSKNLSGVGTNFLAALEQGQLIRVGGTYYNRVGIDSFSDVVLTGTNNFSSTQTNVLVELVTNSFVSTGALIQPMPKSFVRSLRSSDDATSTMHYTTTRHYTEAVSSYNATITLSVPGESFTSPLTLGNYVIAAQNGAIYTSAQYTVTRISDTQITINIPSLSSGTIEVLAKITKNVGASKEKQKTLKTHTFEITNVAKTQATTIQLPNADIYRIVKIMQSTGIGTVADGNYPAFIPTDAIDLTSNYTMLNGQNSFYYDLGSIVLNKGAKTPTNTLVVVYEYFQHSAGDYCSVNSYGNLPYEMLTPLQTNTLDFRPVIGTSDFTTGQITEPLVYGSDFVTDYSYYLPRSDLLEVKSDGSIVIVNGKSGYDLHVPNVDADAMGVATTIVAPGNIDINIKTVQITPIGVKRYTMKDVGNLDQRISDLEYYTQLSLLENQTLNTVVTDQNGLDRFKAGILVDSLSDAPDNTVDSTNPDHKVAVDYNNGIARAAVDVKNINMNEFFTIDAQRITNNYRRTGNTITLPYSNVTAISQINGNAHSFINPFQILSYSGIMTLYPNNDVWVDQGVISNNTVYASTPAYNAAVAAGHTSGTWDSWTVNYQTYSLTSQTRWLEGVSSGSFTSSSLTGQTNGVVLLAGLANNGYDSTQSNNWLTAANAQLYAANGLMLGTWMSNQGGGFLTGDGNSRYQFEFQGTNTRSSITQTYSSSTNVVNEVPLGYTRTRPIFFKVEGCMANTTMNTITFGNTTLPIDQSGDVEPVMTVRIAGTAPVIRTFYDTSVVSDYEKIIQADARTVSFVTLEKYSSSPDVILWDKGALITNANGATAIVGDVIQYTGYYELKCVNSQGNWSTGNYAYVNVDGTSLGLASSVSTAAISHTVAIDANGRGYGVFYPTCNDAKRFLSGTNTLTLANNTNPLDVTSSAAADYYASGLSQQVNQITTITNDVSTQVVGTLNSTQIVNYHEPIAQTFLIDKSIDTGIFVTGIGIYISATDTATPLVINIASTLNGYPTQNYLATKTVYSRQVAVNATTPVETVIYFDNPVFLASGAEYAVVMTSAQSIAWKTWVNDLTIPSAVNSNMSPSIGSFFESQNSSTWTADQTKDLTFKLYRASFITSAPADVVYVNNALPGIALALNSLYSILGSSKVRVNQPSHGFIIGDKVTIRNFLPGSFTTLGSSAITKTLTVIDTKYDSYLVDFAEISGGTASYTGYFGGASAQATYQIQFSTVMPSIDIMSFAGTDFTIGMTPVSYAMLPSKQLTAAAEVVAVNNKTVELNTSCVVLSSANEVPSGVYAGGKSFKLRVTLTSTKENLSPSLRVDRTNLVLVRNRINNPSYLQDADSPDNNFDDINLLTLQAVTYNYNQNSPETSSITVAAGYDANVFSNVSIGKYITVTGGTTANSNHVFLVKSVEDHGTSMVIGVDGTQVINTTTGLITTFTDELAASGKTSTMILKNSLSMDIAPYYSSILSNYVSAPMTLSVPATGVRVTLDINNPVGTYLEVYYRGVQQNGYTFLNMTAWEHIPNPAINNTNDLLTFKETTWEASNGTSSFDQIQIKIVLKSDVDSKTPKFKNVRVMALA